MKVKKASKKTPARIYRKEAKPLKQIEKVKVATSVTKIEATKSASHETTKIISLNEKNRYSETELAQFRVRIIDKLEEAKRNYEFLRANLCYRDDNGTEDTAPTFKVMEDGSEVMARQETAQLALRQEKFIENLQNALLRIENKIYGICRVTGKLIPKERLFIVPHATLSIGVKLER